jgi:hypothetical protein
MRNAICTCFRNYWKNLDRNEMPKNILFVSPLSWFDALEHTVAPASRRPKEEKQNYSQNLL